MILLIWSDKVIIIFSGSLICYVLFHTRECQSLTKIKPLSNLSWQVQNLVMSTNLRLLSYQLEIHPFKVGHHHNHIVCLHIDFRGPQSPSRWVKAAQSKTTLTVFFDSQNWFFYYWVGIFCTFNSFWSTWRSISNWYIWWRNLSYTCSCGWSWPTRYHDLYFQSWRSVENFMMKLKIIHFRTLPKSL